MNRLWRRSIIFVLVMLMCIGIGTQAQDGGPNVDDAVIAGLDVSDPPLCVVPIPFLDGQVWRASGANGGLTATNPGVSDTAYNYAQSKFTGLISGSEPVAILIVDSFGQGFLPGAFYPLITTMYVSGEFGNDDGLANALNAGTLSHGGLVRNHVFGLLYGAGYTPDGSGTGFIWTNGNSTIYVGAVNIDYSIEAGVNANDVSTAIIRAVTTMKVDFGVTQFVVNESFAVIPCIVASHTDDYPRNSFKEYLDEVEKQSGGNFGYAEVTGTTTEDIDKATLHRFALIENGEYCGGFLDDVQAQFVASSGNSSLEFPFAPAGWPNVIGVTASEALDHSTSDGYANWVEADEIDNVPGGWYQFEVPSLDPTDPNRIINTLSIFYRGTSFSAPTYAVQAAIEMTGGSVSNAINPCSSEPVKSE